MLTENHGWSKNRPEQIRVAVPDPLFSRSLASQVMAGTFHRGLQRAHVQQPTYVMTGAGPHDLIRQFRVSDPKAAAIAARLIQYSHEVDDDIRFGN
jgi:hypothetical protein